MARFALITALALCSGCIFGGSGTTDGPDGSLPDSALPDATMPDGDLPDPPDVSNNLTPDMGAPDMPLPLCALVDCQVGFRCNSMTGECESICEPTEEYCVDACVQVANDEQNCGACGNDCAAQTPEFAHVRSCTDGECIFECDEGRANIDLSDPDCESLCMPTGEEVCDGEDNDCNGAVDDGLPTTLFYRDGDGDGFGDPNVSEPACDSQAPDGYVPDAGDCNDGESAINPSAIEQCDGIDTDCDPMNDDATREECVQTVFLTSTAYSGDVSSQGGPDGICEIHGITRGASYGSWRAIAGVDNVAAVQRVRQIGEIRLPSGTKLWDAGDIFTVGGPAVPITETELGVSPGQVSGRVWTASFSNGNFKSPHCENWSSASSNREGSVGNPNDSLNWLNSINLRPCDELARFYCIDGQL